MQLEQFLESSAERLPEKLALVCGRQRLTYREIDHRSNQLAQTLASVGVARGDRVVMDLENGPDVLVAIFAVLKAGAVFSAINPTTKPERINFILNDCRAKAFVSHAAKLQSVREAVALTPHLATVVLAGVAAAPEPPLGKTVVAEEVLGSGSASDRRPRKSCIDVDLAALVYTSGSTGVPKGVMLTHHNMVAAATSITTYLENVQDDVILGALPLSFDYGLYQALMAFKIGGTLVLEKSFTYPHDVLTRIGTERVTGLPIVPTMSAILLQLDLSKYDFSSLRYITNTAAALPTEHVVRLRRLFPDVRLYSMYGLTECKRVAYLPPDQVDARPASVGKAMPNVEVYVVDEAGQRLAPGSTGELVVRGSNVMRGYWERPEETERALRPGPIPGERVLYTGDLFRIDEEGYLYFVGRRDDMLKCRGEKVSPREVENVLYRLEGVNEAAVIGVPDPVLGQAVKAFIVASKDAELTVDSVRAHCAQHLENYKVPSLVVFLEAFPTTGSGKIDKRLLTTSGA